LSKFNNTHGQLLHAQTQTSVASNGIWKKE